MLKIGITGGIGSGKSVVSSIFKELGIDIFNSDKEAKIVTHSNSEVIAAIKSTFGEESYLLGELNSKYIASQVFSDRTLLERLNKIVHPAVTDRFEKWCNQRELEGKKYIIFESAILIESGLTTLVDKILCVTAPVEVRIARVESRDSISREDVIKRINNQLGDSKRLKYSHYKIVNDDRSLIIPQIIELNSIFTNDSRK